MTNTIWTKSSKNRAERIYRTYQPLPGHERKVGHITDNHFQYRASISPTVFNRIFDENLWNEVVLSGRKTLANFYASDVPLKQRVQLFDGSMEFDETTEIGANFAKVFGNSYSKIDDFKFNRIESGVDSNTYWYEECTRILDLIGPDGWVEINEKKLYP